MRALTLSLVLACGGAVAQPSLDSATPMTPVINPGPPQQLTAQDQADFEAIKRDLPNVIAVRKVLTNYGAGNELALQLEIDGITCRFIMGKWGVTGASAIDTLLPRFSSASKCSDGKSASLLFPFPAEGKHRVDIRIGGRTFLLEGPFLVEWKSNR